jgi:hypothetical protein
MIMRRTLRFILISAAIFPLFLVAVPARAQVGLCYFFPEHGSFSIPLAPLSYSQPITFGRFRYIKLTPGGSLYNIGGMSVKGFPAEYGADRPLIGHFYSLLLSVMPSVSIPIGAVDLDFCGGYWGAYNICPKLIQGNMDKMLMDYEGWDVCTSDLSFKNRINHGYVVGMSLTIWFNDKQAIAPGLFYYVGGSKLGLNGTYSGAKLGDPVETRTLDMPDSRLNYRGFEVQIALQL